MDLKARAWRRYRAFCGASGMALAAMSVAAAPARGADIPLACPLAVDYVAVCGRSYSTRTVYDDRLVATRRSVVETFSTELRETAFGARIYDRIFDLPASDPAVQRRLAALRGRSISTGAPLIAFGSPRLVSSSTTLVSSVSSFDAATTGRFQATYRLDYFGPRTVGVGPEQATPLVIGPGAVDHDTLSVTQLRRDVTQSIVDTILTSQIWSIDGVIRAIGTQHVGLIDAGFDQIERFADSLRGRLATAPEASGGPAPSALKSGAAERAPSLSGWSSWASGYGWRGRVSSSGLYAADKRSGAGAEAGVTYAPGGGWRLAAGVDQGRARIDQDALGGRATLDMTQIGLAALWRGGGAFATVAATVGWGEGDARQTPLGFGWTARANARMRVATLSGEFGYDWRVGALTLTPTAGAAVFHVRRAGFAERDTIVALTGATASWTRATHWLGLIAAQRFDLGAGQVTLSGQARFVGLGGDRRIKAPVTFSGMVDPLQISGPRNGCFGADFGAAATYTITRSVTARVSYDLRLRRGQVSHFGAASLNVGF